MVIYWNTFYLHVLKLQYDIDDYMYKFTFIHLVLSLSDTENTRTLILASILYLSCINLSTHC
jgi:hypothetical protein